MTRVLNPSNLLSEICKMRPSPSRNSPTLSRNLDRIKRDLFGPVNSAETTKIFNDEIEKHQEKAIKKWGFDFRSGSPLSNGSQFVWERVSFNDFVPEMYTLSRAAHVRPIDSYEDDVANNYDMLLDERAERANIMNLSSSPLSSPLLSPTVLPGETDIFSDDYQEESMPFKIPAAAIVSATTVTTVKKISRPGTTTTLLSCGKSLRKRQPKITEYMKERKRLAQTPKKSSPAAKRMRSSTSNDINIFFSLPRNC